MYTTYVLVYTNNITVHSSNFYRTWHRVVNAFIYMTVGALDLENGVNEELYCSETGTLGS